MQPLNNKIKTKSCTNFEKGDPRLRHAFFSTTFFYTIKTPSHNYLVGFNLIIYMFTYRF